MDIDFGRMHYALIKQQLRSSNTLTTKRKQKHKYKMKKGPMERTENDSLENKAINKS